MGFLNQCYSVIGRSGRVVRRLRRRDKHLIYVPSIRRRTPLSIRPITEWHRPLNRKINRFYGTLLPLLTYVNANVAACIYFEPPVTSRQQVREATRISLDLWEDRRYIDGFVERGPLFYQKAVDIDLAATWRDALHGPMTCVSASGRKGLFLCEGALIEAHSLVWPWSELLKSVPNTVITTLMPFEGRIVSDGFVLEGARQTVSEDARRVIDDLASEAPTPVIADVQTFIEESRRINSLRDACGLDPTCHAVAKECIDALNDELYDTCFEYEFTQKVRS